MIKYLETHGLKHFTMRPRLEDNGILILSPRCLHLIDLFCAFLLSECQGKGPAEMPLKICRRCALLFVSERKSTEFCPTTKCQWKAYWTPERKSDHEYVRRLTQLADKCSSSSGGYSVADLRKKLEQPKVRQRLQQIEECWHAEWPGIVKKVAEVKKCASAKSRRKASC